MGYSFERQKSETITKASQKLIQDSGRKLSKLLVDKGSEFYN